MSYAFNWRINIDTHHCAISGKRIYNGDQVMDVNRETMQRYGLFLSEQDYINKLVVWSSWCSILLFNGTNIY